MEGFCDRRLDSEYAYLWLDPLYLKVRQSRRIISVATISIGVRENGKAMPFRQGSLWLLEGIVRDPVGRLLLE